MNDVTYSDALEYIKEVIATDLDPDDNTNEPDEKGFFVQLVERIQKAESFEEVFRIIWDFEGWGDQSTYIPRLLDKSKDLVVTVTKQ